MGVWRCWRRGQLPALQGAPVAEDDRGVGPNFNKIGNATVRVKKRLVLEASDGLITNQMLTKALKVDRQ
eukprot:7943493-Lingulodinium_polyedra.AAC.1